MAITHRIGLQIIPSDPFWVQVKISIEQQAQKLGFELVPFDINNLHLAQADFPALVEELMAEEIDAFIILDLPEALIKLILAQDIPIISLAEQLKVLEQDPEKAQLSSPLAAKTMAHLMANFLIEKLQGKGTVLVIGGLVQATDGSEGVGEDGRLILAGLAEIFETYSSIKITHIPASWSYAWAYPQIMSGMQQLAGPPDVIFGLSDTLALAGRTVAEKLGLLTSQTLVVGISGDPLALAAIAEGTMTATVAISAVYFASKATELALRAARKQRLPRHFNSQTYLITAENVSEEAVQKLIAIAELPNHLVGVNRRSEQQHLAQLETSLTINRQVGAILNRHELTQTIINLTRDNYNYDRVQLYLWSEPDQALFLDHPAGSNISMAKVNLAEDEVLSQVLEIGELIFIPDMRNSQRFAPDLNWPELRSRVVLPVKFAGRVLGVLDLQHEKVVPHSREKLLGLQLLADQVGIAIRNAELYSEALEARKVAEKADKLKTLLLANVSHEFRTPLNIILGYAKAALNVPNPYNIELPAELTADLGRIYRSGEHLLRLINDLLDLSRAEIEELEIYPEIIDVSAVLQEVFRSVADLTTNQKSLDWQLELPQNIPLLQADPVRLRQILLNLLSNALKFTQQGSITLGLDVQPPYVHIWVKDTGSGISPDQQSHIFEPFVIGENTDQRAGGIGLGLSIAHHLVTLHRGIINFESEPAKGSTFHVYLPLPNLSGQLLALPFTNQQNLVYISNKSQLPPEIRQLSQQDNLQILQIRPSEVRTHLLDLNPSIIAWDSASATENDWLAIEFLRETQQLVQIPLLLFGDNLNNNQATVTNVLLKPFSGQTLAMMLSALRPEQTREEVLIVDDDISSLDLYEQIILSALPGFTVHRAESGKKALAKLKHLSPSLVIIDLVMPEMDGFEVIEWLRTNPATRTVPILVVSGKVLSAEYIQRLDYSRVIFQPKDLMYSDEVTDTLQKISGGVNFLPQFNSIRVKRILAYLQENYTRPISLNEIAQSVGLSKNYLGEIFHHELGISPGEYLTRFRILQAKRLLKTTNFSISEVGAQIGIEDSAYFSRTFRAHTGKSPKEYRNSSLNL